MSEFGVYLVQQNTGDRFPLSGEEKNTIGRDTEGEIELAVALVHPAVSRKHATIELDAKAQRWIFCNLSDNSSMVNNEIVSRKELSHGDQISIGPFDLIFYEKFAADKATMEIPIIKYKPGRMGYPEDWDQEITPLGSSIETVAMIFFVALSIFIFLCCFVW